MFILFQVNNFFIGLFLVLDNVKNPELNTVVYLWWINILTYYGTV